MAPTKFDDLTSRREWFGYIYRSVIPICLLKTSESRVLMRKTEPTPDLSANPPVAYQVYSALSRAIWLAGSIGLTQHYSSFHTGLCHVSEDPTVTL